MKIDIITLFPDMFRGPFDESIIHRARQQSLVDIVIHNLRSWAVDKRGTVDSPPYGGGVGMLLRPEPIFDAVEKIASDNKNKKSCIVLLDAGGTPYNQKTAKRYSTYDQLILICGHYEGVDYRIHEHLADEVISIGDYILTGGEIPAMTIVDSVARLIPGVIEKEAAIQKESFSSNSKIGEESNVQLVEYPQYTRPETYKGYKVPTVLLSGHHKQIEAWRENESRKRTKQVRPDL